MKVQFIGIKYREKKPYFLFYKDKMFTVPIDGNIYMKRYEKRCAGYYDLEKHCYMPCAKLNKISDKTVQCDECRELSSFQYCLGCHGMNCLASGKALKFCNQEHVVYLALFGDRIKVGTAAFYRKEARVFEQGALTYMFIAKCPNGKIARLIEYKISQKGLTLQVLSSFKIKNLVLLESKEDVLNKLMDTYNNLKNNLDGNLTKYFIKPEFYFNEDIVKINNDLLKEGEQFSLFESEIKVKDYFYNLDPDVIEGNILSVTGQILILENEEIKVFDTKKLSGYIVDFKRKV